MPAEVGDGERALPAIIAERPHRALAPLRFILAPIEEHGRERVVAVGKDVGLDHDLVAERALGGVAPAVDLGLDVFDDDPATTVVWQLHRDTRARLARSRSLGARREHARMIRAEPLS
jgi:hypothetical protein